MKKFAVIAVFLVALLFGATFTMKNHHDVTLSYYFGMDWHGPLSWLLIMTFAIGAVVGVAMAALTFLKRRLAASKRAAAERR